ncbi:hypothetical protein M409DRAFT_49764 [Zasmidium cellare ATCC 36951]|uniref:Large ribosomal subunit protein bL28m n=1 Tax=Zasmidium cellare ATCC 36951 TaxID=1080233 RepID=A0A6A6D513_ZASCE|nr:uncharacterized protein M409DRAFT_49764 [Zasmidium cellare ATCC 36951]KAF2173302.1 hypothetical protein M409DRAFT_49764 [Zasmidium cellare ATCC 36951]
MAALFRQPRAICQCRRTFSTSSLRGVSLQWDKNDPEALAEVLPPYPHGPTRWFRQSRLGLYGGQRIQFGNNVSEEFKTKTRRSWHPNIFTRRLFSKALNRHVQVRVSARVLRTIDKLGGLDEYLLGEKSARIKSLGESGWWLRWAIMQTHTVKNRFAAERQRLGLPADRSELEAVAETLGEEEDASLDEEGLESVPMDDAFQIEQSADLPPIKFRVDRFKHVMLTSNGWVRTKPSPDHAIQKAKDRVQEKYFPQYVEKRLEAFEADLKHKLEPVEEGEEPELELSERQYKELVKHTRREFKRELRQLVDRKYEKELAFKESKKQAKREHKSAAKQDAEEEQDAIAA